jgi:iron(III) transport system permease protein
LVLSLAYNGSNKMKSIITISTIGYALPGSVIAVGLLIVVNEIFGVSITSLGIFGLIICLSIRFMTPAFQYLVSALDNIPESSKQALATLPSNPLKAFISLYLPSLKPALLVAFLVVFIEVVKEQPATLILRPVGFETLSSKIYNFTSEGQWELAANPSLLLVMLSFVLVYFLNKRLDQ